MPFGLSTHVLEAFLVFLGTYVVLAIGGFPGLRIDRPGAAIIGAILMVELGVVSLDAAYQAIDYRTIILLFGMMVLIAHLRMARFFRSLVRWVISKIHHPGVLLAAIVYVSGILSALFVNDTICLLLTPVLIEMARRRSHDPLPYLLALATASNIGSVATITGNPQNMLIGSLSRISYLDFLSHLGPVAFVGLTIDAALIWFLFRKELHPGPSDFAEPVPRSVHRMMMVKGLTVALLVLGGFLMGLEPALVSAAGAAALLVTRTVNPEKVWREIDWDLLMLFAGLFIVTAGVEASGLNTWFFEFLRPLGIETVWGMSATSALLSNLISNVPAVMLFAKTVPQMPDPKSSWLALAMSSTLAGNLTLLGSIANLIVLEGARRRGFFITFAQYLKVGLTVTLLTMAFGILWLS